MSSRREFLVTGASAVALSVAIFKSVQGPLGKLAQYAGHNLSRPLDGPVAPPPNTEIDEVAHVLNRWTFGPVPGEYARVSAMGVQAFLEEQLAPPEIEDGLCDRAIARFSEAWWEPLGEAYEESAEALTPVLRRVTLLRAIYSKRQLFEVMCGFWSDHFNIDPNKGDSRFAKIDDDRRVVRRHALGKFQDMLKASILSPAMLWYLDGRANTRSRPEEQANENYARELMELHTLGVDGGYTQQDVMEVARCLTGWTIPAKEDDGFSGDLLSPFKDRARVFFRPEAHDDGAKTVLGQEIPAGLGEGDLDEVVRIVAHHPSTARFLAQKLCIRFIADDPPGPAVREVEQAFTDHDGDLTAMLRTLFATPEFRASAGQKFKRPFHFLVSALRATNAHTDGDRGVMSYLERMGQVPFGYPTPDGYPMEAAPWHATLLWRWKFALALANNRIEGTRIERDQLTEAFGGETGLVASIFNRRARAGEESACRKSGDALALALASPAFQSC